MTDPFYSHYPQYSTIRDRVAAIALRHKGARVFSAGRSVLGRELYTIAIGNEKNATCIIGGTHALEHYSVLASLRFCEEILDSLEKRTPIYDHPFADTLPEKGLIILPCLNPDGLELWQNGLCTAGDLRADVERWSGGDLRTWQANARGVDINHNFDAGFDLARQDVEKEGFTGPGPTRYGGPHAFSEPESATVKALCEQYGPRMMVALHSQGEEIFYQYGGYEPKKSELLARMLARISGYELVQQTGTASHAGLKDWYLQEYGRPGFTLELGRGKNPLDIVSFPETYAKVGRMLAILATC